MKKTNEYLIPWLATYVVLTVVYSVSCFVITSTSVMVYKMEMWNWGGEFITFFLPLIAVLPISHIFLGKIKNGFISYANMRNGNKNYAFKEIAKSMLSSGSAIFASYFTTLLIVIFFLDIESPWNSSNLQNYIFGEMQINNPLLFGFIWSLWIGFVSSIFVLFSCVLSLFVRNYFLVTLAPFVYLQAENLITSILTIPQYSLMTSIHLNRLDPVVMTPFHYIFGVLTFSIMVALVFLILRQKKGGRYECD